MSILLAPATPDDVATRLGPALSGRTIALVGNARSLGETTCGAEIDGCDLVVRLNAAPMGAASSHGRRTGWLAASIFVPAARLRALQPRAMLWMSPKGRWRAAARYGWRGPLSFYPLPWWRELSTALGGNRPSTGLMTIDLLRRIGGFAELRLFGFDFFASGSLSVRKIGAPPPHDFARERQHVARLLETTSCIRLVRAAGQSA